MNGPLGSRDYEGRGVRPGPVNHHSSGAAAPFDGTALLRQAPDLSHEHRSAVVRIVRRTGLLQHPRLSDASKLLFVVGTLMADANGVGSPDAVTVALGDPSIVQVERSIIAAVMSR